MKELTSIIIPCRNGAGYLPEAVAGIRRQNMPVEIIVVDDGSTDATAAVAKKLGCIVSSIPHSGLSAARNEGLKLARGDCILFHDHDDVLRDGALARLHAELPGDEKVRIVMAMARDFISPELAEADKKLLAPRPEPYYGLLSGAVLIRRDVFEKIEAFTEDLATGQTMDFLLRAEQAGVRVRRIDFLAVDRRLHNNNMGRSMQQQENRDYAGILRMKLRRG
jgi:glycosyltransferase involved in cell wall biosynthesis